MRQNEMNSDRIPKILGWETICLILEIVCVHCLLFKGGLLRILWLQNSDHCVIKGCMKVEIGFVGEKIEANLVDF
jgi:hypothetical protein